MTKKLTAFGFYTITSAMVMSVYVYPTFSTAGFALVIYLLISGLLWFLPTALCSAEMATITQWNNGGIYTWVDKTFGKRFAFVAVFFQWFQVTIGFVTMLYFIVGMLSAALKIPEINDNPYIKLTAMLIIFWTVSLLQFLGNKATDTISKIGFFLGVLVPVVSLIILTVIYMGKSNTINLTMSVKTFFPDFTSINSMVVFASFVLAYLGIEASANEIHNVKNSSKTYPKVITIFCITSIVINTLAGLAIAILVPNKDINLSTGIIQAFENAIKGTFPALTWLPTVMACILTFSTIAKIGTWIVAPSEGFYLTAQEKILPKLFLKKNKNDIPVNIILLQSGIATVWCVVLTLSSTHSNMAFLLSLSLTILIYLLAYFLMYFAYFKVVLKMDSLERGYHVSKHKSVKILLAFFGILTTTIAFIVSFFPPSSLSANEGSTYVLILIASFIVTAIIPFAIYALSAHKTAETTNNKKDG